MIQHPINTQVEIIKSRTEKHKVAPNCGVQEYAERIMEILIMEWLFVIVETSDKLSKTKIHQVNLSVCAYECNLS